MTSKRRSSISDIQNDTKALAVVNAQKGVEQDFFGPPPKVTVEEVENDGSGIPTPADVVTSKGMGGAGYTRYRSGRAANIQAQATVANQTKDKRYQLWLGNTVAGFGNALYHRTKVVGTRTSNYLDRLPTPGNIALPLGILLLFMLVLLPVNGHTRLMWLWLALTKNAEIGPVQPPVTLNVPTALPLGAQGIPFNLGNLGSSLSNVGLGPFGLLQPIANALGQGSGGTGRTNQMVTGTHTNNPTGQQVPPLSNKSHQQTLNNILASTHSQRQSHTATIVNRSGFD